MTINQKRGIDFDSGTQLQLLRMYVHRFTKDHKPQWAMQCKPDGTPYAVQFASDKEWLANTFFYVTNFGKLDKRYGNCLSYPTWPNNPELRGK